MSQKTAWEKLYQESWKEPLKQLQSLPGVVIGFHSTIDGLCRVDPARLAQALKDHPDWEKWMNSPLREIEEPAQFLGGLVSSMTRGKALQLMVRQEATSQWIQSTFGWDQIRMGGTSGNMANSLAPLGLPILIYANPLTKEQAELFLDLPNIQVMTTEAGEYRLAHPHKSWQGEGLRALHWIGEYPTGLEVATPSGEFTTPRANRFIAAWNPVNNRMELNPTFTEGLLAKADCFSHFLISGFHILSETYPDGTLCEEVLQRVARYLRSLRQAGPHLRMHYEFASIASSRIRKGIQNEILPLVDSLGLNEVELVAILGDLGAEELARAIEKDESIQAIQAGLVHLMDTLSLKRVQLHNLGYYLTLTQQGYAQPEASRGSLLLAAALAANRSATGRIGGESEIPQALETPISQQGLTRLQEWANLLGEPQIAETGMAEIGSYQAQMIPTKVVERPVLTVGLGDIISSSAFLADPL